MRSCSWPDLPPKRDLSQPLVALVALACCTSMLCSESEGFTGWCHSILSWYVAFSALFLPIFYSGVIQADFSRNSPQKAKVIKEQKRKWSCTSASAIPPVHQVGFDGKYRFLDIEQVLQIYYLSIFYELSSLSISIVGWICYLLIYYNTSGLFTVLQVEPYRDYVWLRIKFCSMSNLNSFLGLLKNLLYLAVKPV